MLALGTTTILASCGAASPTGSGATLESWRESACAALTAYAKAVEPPEEVEPDSASLFSADEERRRVEAMRRAVAELEAIPVPDEQRAEQRANAERFVELFTTAAERYEEALPRIEAASRRLQEAIKAIDPDDLPPAPKEPTTVAGGIMSQMMSVPEVADAFADMMRAYESVAAGIDEKEAERLTERLGLSECGGKPAAEKRLSADELARCGSRGKPVSLTQLVEVFRKNGITLDIDEETCVTPEKDQVGGFDSDATNTGPLGRDQSDEREGHVLCDIEDDDAFGEGVEVTKWPTDTETSMRVLNVDCTIYPHSPDTEAEQVPRLRKAMQAVADLAP